MARRKPITAAECAYNVLLQPEPEGGYTVTCPALPGLVTYGETLEEVRWLRDAIEGYRKCLEEDGLPLPESDPVAVSPLVDQIRVKLASR